MLTILSGSGKEMSGRRPGKNHIISFMQRSFWFPALARDVQEFVSVCSTWAQNKTSSSPPTRLLRPLPTPGRPWSHIALPPFLGNITILIIVDCFFKAAHFVALPKSPTALETARAGDVVKQPWLHDIPKDTVSDQGPQVTSRVWKCLSI